MGELKKQKGITLIALIITIIVLLILALVIIGAIRNESIIEHADHAIKEYGDGEKLQNLAFENYIQKIQAYMPNGSGIGDAVSGGKEELELNNQGFFWNGLYVNEEVGWGFVFYKSGTTLLAVDATKLISASASSIGERYGFESAVTVDYNTISPTNNGKTITLTDEAITLTLVENIDMHGIYCGDTYKFTNFDGSEETFSVNEDGSVYMMGATFNATWTIPKYTGTTQMDGITCKAYSSLDGNICYINVGSYAFVAYREASNAEGNNSTNHSETIPNGAVYYTGVTSNQLGNYTGYTNKYEVGDAFPATVNDGDVYVYGDYEYRYQYVYHVEANAWITNETAELTSPGWGVRVLGGTKNSYEKALAKINNENVSNFYSTYAGNTVLTTIPEIPDSATYLNFAFWGCSALESVSNLPNSIIDIDGAFQNCTLLKSVNSLPTNLKNMSAAFENCPSLTYVAAIPSKVENMRGTFNSCTSLVNGPDWSSVVNLKDISGTFTACEKLAAVEDIPSTVTNMTETFYGCVELSGRITINTNPSEYTNCFFGTVNEIFISGSCDIKEELAKTSRKGNVKY